MKTGKVLGINVKLYQRIAISWLILSGFMTTLKAEPVDAKKARAVALTQLKKATKDVSLRSANSLNLVYEAKSNTSQPYFYVFNGDKGFVIVSGDDRATPILGYSDDGYFDPNDIPPNMAEFLDGYQKEINHVIEHDMKPTSVLVKKWKSLESNDGVQIKSYTPNTNLIQSGWGQGVPFNNYCPMDYSGSSPQRSVVGCIATAMAQIIRYWGADKNIAPMHGFNGSVFETAYYDYANMPVAINPTFPQEQQHAVALLSYHCGVAANMNYSVHGSDATMMNAAKGLREHFGYSDAYCVGTGTVTSTSITALKGILRSELDKEQPVLYAGGNHAFICDGYNSSDEFHMNWGWNSHCDGWYQLTALNPDDNNYSYHIGATIIYNIYPVRDVTISNGNRSVIYVTPEGAGTGDGSSWENATPYLHDVVQQNYSEPKQIWVKKGTYYGNISAGSNLAAFVITGNNRVYGGFEGYESSLEERQLFNPSILDGQNVCRVLCQTSDFVLSETSLWDGFTIQNGLNNQNGSSNIELDSYLYPTVSGNDRTGNGGGVYLMKNSILRNCTIKNCTAISGGGVFNNGGEVIDCSFYNNQAEMAGALYNSSEGIVQLSNSIVENNETTGSAYMIYGGGLFNSGHLYIYEGTEIRNNSSKCGGGVYNNGIITILSGSISSNTGREGGGIYNEGELKMSGGSISYNEASSNGGGIVITNIGKNNALNTFSGGSIFSNTSSRNGGGIICYSGTLQIKDSIKIQENSALQNGGGIYSRGSLYLISGTIGVNTQNAPNSKDEALASGGNYAVKGGGVYAESDSYLQYVHFESDSNIIIGGNYATYGGGLYIDSPQEESAFRNNIIICGNAAEYDGGGLYCSGYFILNGCSISYNKSKAGGGIYFYGTGARPLKIVSALITNNSAEDGGGLYCVGERSAYRILNMSGGEISGNDAEKGAGIYNSDNGQYIISDSAKIKDIVYLRRFYSSRESNTCYLQSNDLTYHINGSFPIFIEISDASGSEAIIAKYNTTDEATVAVNSGIFNVLNYGWRPVAEGTYVKLEQYTPSVALDYVVYVTPEGVGLQDGSSWENATSDLYSEMMMDRTDTMQIWVKEGIYYGDTAVGQGGDLAAFVLGKRNKVYGSFAGNESSLSARAQNNPSILDGQNLRRVLCQLTDFADVDSSFIDGFTIRNGLDTIIGSANIQMNPSNGQTNQSGSDMTGNGGGAYLRTNGIFKNCIIENCKARSGGGVFNYGGKVISCSFISNEAEHAGGLFNRGMASLGNCIISNNKTTYLQGGFYPLGYGGGIFNMDILYILDSTLISNNKGIVGNGIYTHSDGMTTVNGGEISENTGGEYGGGIYSDGNVVIYGGDIINNQAGRGGGITSHGTLTLYGGNISDNISDGAGGGISNGGILNISGSSVKISGNLATSWGGGIASHNGTVNISAGTIGVYTNVTPSSSEEALSMGGNVSLGLNGDGGGGIWTYSTINFINENKGDVIIGGNYTNAYGGGIYVKPVVYNANTSFSLPSNVHICGNTSQNNGGGIYASGKITFSLNACSISYNKSKTSGGGISQSNYLYVNEGAVISNNEAVGNGGGIHNEGYLYMSGGELSGNEVTNNGGAIFNSGSLYIYGGEISGNSATLGDGIYNSSTIFSLYGSIKMNDILYIPSYFYAVDLGNFTYHTDSSKPITIQGNTGYYVAKGPSVQSYVDQEILISTPGLYPVVQNNSYVYLYNNGARSIGQQSATVNDNIGLEKISVYPTLITSGGTLTIESPDGGDASIWNMSGSVVGQYKLEYGKTKMPIYCQTGNYIFKVKTDTGKEKVIKIIVK
jgi:predicted outer membrane repeat protein